MTEGAIGQGETEYKIVVEGHLDERWARRFGEMRVTPLPGGLTELCGPVADQPALHGTLSRIRDLGLVLILVERLGSAA